MIKDSMVFFTPSLIRYRSLNFSWKHCNKKRKLYEKNHYQFKVSNNIFFYGNIIVGTCQPSHTFQQFVFFFFSKTSLHHFHYSLLYLLGKHLFCSSSMHVRQELLHTTKAYIHLKWLLGWLLI